MTLKHLKKSCDSFNKTSKELSEKDVEIDKKLCDLESRSMRENLIRAANECWRSSIVFGLSVCPSVRGHSYSVIFNRIYSKFHIWIAFINLSFKFKYSFCPTPDNQDGQQNGRHLSISAVVVTLTFNQISSKFHI